MLDVIDFIAERGGNPGAVRESQRRRNAPEAVVDEVIALFEDHRKSPVVTEIQVDDRANIIVCSKLCSIAD